MARLKLTYWLVLVSELYKYSICSRNWLWKYTALSDPRLLNSDCSTPASMARFCSGCRLGFGSVGKVPVMPKVCSKLGSLIPCEAPKCRRGPLKTVFPRSARNVSEARGLTLPPKLLLLTYPTPARTDSRRHTIVCCAKR